MISTIIGLDGLMINKHVWYTIKKMVGFPSKENFKWNEIAKTHCSNKIKKATFFYVCEAIIRVRPYSVAPAPKLFDSEI